MSYKMTEEDKQFVAYLKQTLVPDLRSSGYEATADDFDTAVELIDKLSGKI